MKNKHSYNDITLKELEAILKELTERSTKERKEKWKTYFFYLMMWLVAHLSMAMVLSTDMVRMAKAQKRKINQNNNSFLFTSKVNLKSLI